jgi:hypothetical protein
MAIKSINFKGMILNEYKGYSNEILGIASSVPYNCCIKILKA